MTQVFNADNRNRGVGIGEHLAFMETTPKRVRAVLSGIAIADSTEVQIMYETNHQPVYYFPPESIDWGLMEPTTKTTH